MSRNRHLDMMGTIAVGQRRGEAWGVRTAQVPGVAVEMTPDEYAEHDRFMLCSITGREHVFDCPCPSASGDRRCACGKNFCACGEWIFEEPEDTEHVRWGLRFAGVATVVAVVVIVGLVIVAVTL